jgi:hypothetical protein
LRHPESFKKFEEIERAIEKEDYYAFGEEIGEIVQIAGERKAQEEQYINYIGSIKETSNGCSNYSSQSTCDADDGCSWCISAAVKPACNTIEDAKTLPPAVFKCDKISNMFLF